MHGQKVIFCLIGSEQYISIALHL